MLIESIIEEKRKNNSGCAPRDVVDVLINDASDQLTDDLISDNMIDLMIPAEDSVPVLVTLAVKYLSECPLALQHLQVPNRSGLNSKNREVFYLFMHVKMTFHCKLISGREYAAEEEEIAGR